MMTTIEIDEPKLQRVMALTGSTTRKAAPDFALTQAERIAGPSAAFRSPSSSSKET